LANPEVELQTHADAGEMTEAQEASFKELCMFAPLATVSYEEKQHTVQWLVQRGGYELVAGHLVSNQKVKDLNKPNFALLCNRKTKVAVFSCRGTKLSSDNGTKNLQDVVVDLQVDPAKLGESADRITGMCHGGMLTQAQWMVSDAKVADWMHKLSNEGYQTIFTGHSLGGGLAILLALLTKNKHPGMQITALTYCPAAVIEESAVFVLRQKCVRADALLSHAFF
jgi:dienelactone hydrolase